MLLKDKVAVIYGAGGAIGGAVARAFAREGAKVFLTGRTLAPVETVAREIGAASGRAEAAQLDALDEAGVERHLGAVLEKAGRIDISFNAVGVRLATSGIVGQSLLELDAARFSLPIATYTTSYFITARSAAKLMLPKGSGVIMTVTSLPARMGSRLNGGYGSAHAAKEALTRDLSAELAPRGIRVVGIRPHGMPETRTMHEIFERKATGMSWEQFEGYLASTSHPRRVLKLSEMAEVAAFVASDRASGMTGTTVNLTMGALDD